MHAAAGNERAFAFLDACVSAGVQAAGPSRARGSRRRAEEPRRARGAAHRRTHDDGGRDAGRRPRPARGDAAGARARRRRTPRCTSTCIRAPTRSSSAATPAASAAARGSATRSGGVSFLISPTAFFQTNVDAAERLVAARACAPCPTGFRCSTSTPAPGSSRCRWRRRGTTSWRSRRTRAAVADGEASRALNRIPAGAVPLGRRDGRRRPSPASPPATPSCSTRRARGARPAVRTAAVRRAAAAPAGLRVVQSRDAGPRPGRRGRPRLRRRVAAAGGHVPPHPARGNRGRPAPDPADPV